MLLTLLQIQLLTSLQKCYWFHYNNVTDFITKSTDSITKVLLMSLQKCYWLHYKFNYWLHYKSATDYLLLYYKEILTSLWIVCNIYKQCTKWALAYLFWPSSYKMSSINILEGLESIFPIQMCRELMDVQSCFWMCFDYISMPYP